jgi:hypothetical protein
VPDWNPGSRHVPPLFDSRAVDDVIKRLVADLAIVQQHSALLLDAARLELFGVGFPRGEVFLFADLLEPPLQSWQRGAAVATAAPTLAMSTTTAGSSARAWALVAFSSAA